MTIISQTQYLPIVANRSKACGVTWNSDGISNPSLVPGKASPFITSFLFWVIMFLFCIYHGNRFSIVQNLVSTFNDDNMGASWVWEGWRVHGIPKLSIDKFKNEWSIFGKSKWLRSPFLFEKFWNLCQLIHDVPSIVYLKLYKQIMSILPV